MKSIIANITVIFWAFIFGEILGYITSQLTGLSYNFTEVGVLAAVVVLITVNCLSFMFKRSVK